MHYFRYPELGIEKGHALGWDLFLGSLSSSILTTMLVWLGYAAIIEAAQPN